MTLRGTDRLWVPVAFCCGMLLPIDCGASRETRGRRGCRAPPLPLTLCSAGASYAVRASTATDCWPVGTAAAGAVCAVMGLTGKRLDADRYDPAPRHRASATGLRVTLPWSGLLVAAGLAARLSRWRCIDGVESESVGRDIAAGVGPLAGWVHHRVRIPGARGWACLWHAHRSLRQPEAGRREEWAMR